MTPPPNPQWGQNPYPQPPQTAWAPKPPSPTAALDNELQTWLVVTCAGWVVGFMWITGPLGWWKANDLRDKYAALGAPEPSNNNAMRIIGILTTVMSLLCFAAVCLVVTAVLAFGFRMPF
jgi:hypothetical protein